MWTKHGGVQFCVRDCVLYTILFFGLHVDSDFSWDCVLIVIIIPLRKQPCLEPMYDWRKNTVFKIPFVAFSAKPVVKTQFYGSYGHQDLFAS